MAAQLPELPNVSKISTSIVRVMGGNPNKYTLQGTNTYLLGTGPSRILLDTAQGLPAWASSLSQALESENATVSLCLLSHWHGDHVCGVPDLLKTHPSTPIWKGLGAYDPDAHLTGTTTIHEITDGMTFGDDAGFEVAAVHCPGHTTDHMAFQVVRSTDPAEIGAMFTADNVLGHGTSVFEDLAAYLASLALMKARLPPDRPVRAYPGHGAVVDHAAAKIQEYIDHRRQREDEAVNVLRYGRPAKPSAVSLDKEEEEEEEEEKDASAGAGGKAWTSMDMVRVIYSKYPEHLHEPAERGLLMVLQKLKGDGRVVEVDGKWKVSEKATL